MFPIGDPHRPRRRHSLGHEPGEDLAEQLTGARRFVRGLERPVESERGQSQRLADPPVPNERLGGSARRDLVISGDLYELTDLVLAA